VRTRILCFFTYSSTLYCSKQQPSRGLLLVLFQRLDLRSAHHLCRRVLLFVHMFVCLFVCLVQIPTIRHRSRSWRIPRISLFCMSHCQRSSHGACCSPCAALSCSVPWAVPGVLLSVCCCPCAAVRVLLSVCCSPCAALHVLLSVCCSPCAALSCSVPWAVPGIVAVTRADSESWRKLCR
jgi:hypothetical protein